MFRPEEMCKVNILVLNRDVSEVTRRLGKAGVVHLVDAVMQSPGHLLAGMEDADARQGAAMQLEKCRQLMRQLDVDGAADAPPCAKTPAEVSECLAEIQARYDAANARIAGLIQEVNGMSMQQNRLDAYPIQNVSLDVLRSLSHFQIFTGSIKAEEIPGVRTALKDLAILSEVEGHEGNVLVVCSPKNSDAVSALLDKAGFVKSASVDGFSGTASDESKALGDKLAVLRSQLEACRAEVRALGEQYAAALRGISQKLTEAVALQDVRRHFGRLKSVVCISGWVPRKSAGAVEALVTEVTNGACAVEVTDACDDALVKQGAEQVPSKTMDNALTRPFRNLVENFGIPAYHEIDPTVFFAITYVALFGYMFGDVGHGLVLALAGLFLKFSRVKLPASLRDSGVLLMLCGVCSVLFGFAYGSIFGYEEAFEALWLSPMHDIGTLLLTSIGLGIVFSSVAIIINILNHIHAKDYYEGAFQRFGGLGLVFFWVCLGIGIWAMTGHGLATWMIVLLAIPMVLIMIREPLHHVLHGHGPFHGTGALAGGLECLIEGLEIVTGYFSGTLSFIRVGAFAISHAALCMAVYTLCGLLSDVPLGGFWQVLILVFGNLLVIVFEGMVDMIQCVRLEYYELFGKYFIGGGLPYNPFRLNSRKDA